MSKIVLYSQELSPPCRAVLMAAEAIGVTLTIRDINLLNMGQLSEEFQKVNPQHTIPTLDDDGFIVWDSHAIVCYLVDKYATDDSLYPKDLQKRALVNQRLYFDTGILFPTMRGIFKPIIFHGETSIPQEKLDLVDEAYTFMDKFLEDKKWIAGDSYTVADICCVISVAGLNIVRSVEKFPNLSAWFERCQEHLPGYKKIAEPGNNGLRELLQKALP